MIRRLFLVAVIAAPLLPASAHAGGWSGSESWMLRDQFRRGHTLTRLWDKFDAR